MGLQEVWRRRQPECLPGSINDFMNFLGSDEDSIQKMGFFGLIRLVKGGIKDRGSRNDGISIVWSWEYRNSTIEGRGETLFEAALDGLINYWMVCVARGEN